MTPTALLLFLTVLAPSASGKDPSEEDGFTVVLVPVDGSPAEPIEACSPVRPADNWEVDFVYGDGAAFEGLTSIALRGRGMNAAVSLSLRRELLRSVPQGTRGVLTARIELKRPERRCATSEPNDERNTGALSPTMRQRGPSLSSPPTRCSFCATGVLAVAGPRVGICAACVAADDGTPHTSTADCSFCREAGPVVRQRGEARMCATCLAFAVEAVERKSEETR